MPSVYSLRLRNNNIPIEVVDLFCGVGGLSYGLKRMGFKILDGYDFDASCEFAFEKNTKARFHHRDIKAIQAKCLAFGDRIIKLNDYLLEQAAIANAEKQKAMRHRKGTSSIYHQTSSILPMSVEADFIKVALDSRLNKQGVTMYLQLHSAKFSKE